ncbi:hypothetical protein SNE40_001479 [Patella caerulea]|uniref:Nucleoporin Nup188 N-terminal subdomain III domain-containing protein n=1 Tax=Patella caerulea TaxID=87958 RepID=A0AAN8Q311_PATCE
MAGMCDSFSNRALWQFITGSGIVRPKELIGIELKKGKAKILDGLLAYEKQRATSGERLKDNKSISGLQLDFTLKLSQFLNLDETQSYSLFCSFLVNEFRGSKKNLQQVLSHERHAQALILKIRDYYFTERLYSLRCLRHILNYWPDAEHPYRESYAEFLDDLLDGGKLVIKLLEQFDFICNENLPTIDTHGILMTDSQKLVWANQNLKEQCELLELLLMYYKDFETDTNGFIDLVEKFKKHGFGWRQNYRHILDEGADTYVKRIGYLEVLVLIEALDMENAVRCKEDESFAEHTTLKDQASYQKLRKVFKELGNQQIHSPLLLSWAMMCHLFTDEESASHELKTFGNQALQLHVFEFIDELLSCEPFNGKNIIASISHYIIYTLFYAVLSAFHENTLGVTEILYSIISKLIKQDFIAEEILQKDLNVGVGSLYQSSMTLFPLEFNRFLQLNICLASASTISAKKVKLYLQRLNYYTEYLDNNHPQDLQPTEQDSVFRLVNNKMPYDTADMIINRSSVGQILPLGGGKGEMGGPIIQWQTSYNGWQLLMCEIKYLLTQVSHGAGMVSPTQIDRVTMAMNLVKEVMTSDPECIEEFSDIINLCFTLIQRFSVINPPPLELLSNTMECLNCTVIKHPKPVWHSIKQTGFLPYMTENLDNLGEILSGRGLHAGLYGTILARTECIEARYPLTEAVLKFITNLIEPLTRSDQEEELVPTILYILREIFPVFRKWRFSQSNSRESLGQKCLDLFHKILNFLHLQKKAEKKGLQLQEVCVYSLLFTEAGRALLEIIAIGVDNIELALSQQGSATEGAGIEQIELIQIAFSVLNRLLLLKPPDLPVSPVEHALSSQPAGRQHQHVVATIAQYIYHRHNPKLPTLALVLLKRLAMVSPMSILACLGSEAEPVRDMFLSRLQALSEDLRLKVVILEFLSVCIEYQPGLIEIFLNVQSSNSNDGKKQDLTLGKTSCLQTVLNLMENKKQSTYQCPSDLLCACTDFMQSLWSGLRERAMEVLRAKETFWLSIFFPLERNLLKSAETGQFDADEMKTVAHCLKVLAQEFFVMSSDKLDSRLKKSCQQLAKDKRLEHISECVRDSLISEGKKNKTAPDEITDDPTLLLLLSWKNFLITNSKFKVDELQLTDRVKEKILEDLLIGIQEQFSGDLSVLNMKLASVSSALYFTIIRNNSSSILKPRATLQKLQNIILQTCANSQMLIPSVQIGLLASITSILQSTYKQDCHNIPLDNLSALLPTVCSVLLQSTRQLPGLKELIQKSQQTLSQDKISDIAIVEADIDSKLKLQITCCCLLEELIRCIGDSTIWLTVLQQNSILPTLLISMETYIKAQQGLTYVHSVFLLMLTIAETEKGASALALSNLAGHTCLVISKCYSEGDKVIKQIAQKGCKGYESNSITWNGIYCLCTQLYATMLSTLRYSFLEDCFNFVGAHQDRLHQSLEIGCTTLSNQAMKEAEVTCNFLHQLSFFSREWRFHLPDVLNRLLTCMVYMTQTFVSLLIRPRYLSHILEAQRGTSERKNKIQTSLQSSPLLQQQTSTEDVDHPSTQLVQVQQRMLNIIGRSLAALKQFTPDLCEVLLDQSMDISEYEPLLGMGFCTPSIDQETAPTFGMLISCITSCFRLLTKIDPKGGSPHKSPDSDTLQFISKNNVIFVMENSLYILMSQSCRYLKDPNLSSREKQLLKRELGTELNSFLSSMVRYMRRGGPVSPGSSNQSSPKSTTLNRSISQTAFTNNQEQSYLKLVQEFVRKILR